MNNPELQRAWQIIENTASAEVIIASSAAVSLIESLSRSSVVERSLVSAVWSLASVISLTGWSVTIVTVIILPQAFTPGRHYAGAAARRTRQGGNRPRRRGAVSGRGKGRLSRHEI